MTNISAPAPVGFTFPGPDHRGVFLGLRAPQALILGGSVLVAVAAMVLIPTGAGLGACLICFLTGAGAAFLRVGGQNLDEWTPVVIRWLLQRERQWVTPVALWGEVDGAAGSRAAPPPTLRGVQFLSVKRANGEAVGIVKDPRKGTWCAAVACRGRSFALLDEVEQERRTASWGQAISAFAQEGSPVSRIAWVERTIPEEGDALAAWLDREAVLGPGHPAYDSYVELIASAGPVTQRHETFVVVAVDGSRARKAIRQAGGGDRGAAEVVLRELDHLVDRLRHADVEVDARLSAPALARAVRVAFDPASVHKLSARQRVDPSSGGGSSGRHAWPRATSATWARYRTDSGWHATFHVAEWPRQRVAAAFLHPLILLPLCQRSIAVVMEPVPPSRAARAVESAHASHIADEELRARAGYIETARRRRQHEELRNREEQLARGHAQVRFAGYVTVTAPSEHDLEVAAGVVEQLGFAAGLELRRLYGQQDEAFTYTLPLGRGLGRLLGLGR